MSGTRDEHHTQKSSNWVRITSRLLNSFEIVPDGFDWLEMRRGDGQKDQRDAEFFGSRACVLRDV